MQLEIKRNNMRAYVVASAIASMIMLGFIYLFAYAPNIDPDPDLQLFAGYNHIFPMFSMLGMAVFATLSAIMQARFVIEEYRGKRVILLFSYPVRRDKVLLSKLAVVFLFTMAAMTICNLLAFGIFGITESIHPLVDGAMSIQTIIQALKVTVMMAVTAAGIGIVATGIGFIKKSVPAAIVSAVLLSSLVCNIIFNSTADMNKGDMGALILMGIAVAAAAAVAAMLMNNVNHMEAE